ncbi:hypothetical protein [Streptomyces mirabilis]|uniref:hypothetical protein n=1 Tax=Streptomyces mirabilis TaxID=68239 RepID=UPI0036B1F172
MSSTDALTIETPTGIVRATAGPRRTDAVVFELHGAMRGSVHVTGTHHPRHWDQFTAVRACLGPVNAYATTAPDDALPRLAHGHSGYHGSLTRYPGDYGDYPEVSVYPLSTAAGNEPSPKTAATLTAVLRACADDVAQRDDLPLILDASRLRETPGLLRFLNWAAAHADADAEAVRCAAESQSARPTRKAAVAAWWTALRWFIAQPHPVLPLMLADYPVRWPATSTCWSGRPLTTSSAPPRRGPAQTSTGPRSRLCAPSSSAAAPAAGEPRRTQRPRRWCDRALADDPGRAHTPRRSHLHRVPRPARGPHGRPAAQEQHAHAPLVAPVPEGWGSPGKPVAPPAAPVKAGGGEGAAELGAAFRGDVLERCHGKRYYGTRQFECERGDIPTAARATRSSSPTP